MSNLQTIAVIDYGMGNLHSVSKALEHVAPSAQVIVTSSAAKIAEADRVLLPGVGAIRDCMAEIKRLGVDNIVHQVIASGRPLLGICVGMQALLAHSQENDGVDALGHFKGEIKSFSTALSSRSEHFKVPHMGWNNLYQTIDHPLWHNIDDGERFYFLHSFFAELEGQSATAGRCEYGIEFAAALAENNVFATQFHPEKSQHAGLQLLKNFTEWDGRP